MEPNVVAALAVYLDDHGLDGTMVYDPASQSYRVEVREEGQPIHDAPAFTILVAVAGTAISGQWGV